MTGPINFNPFIGVSGTENIEQIQDRRKSLRFPDIDLSPVDLNMNQGQDEEGMIDLDNIDMSFNKQIPKN
ncbi:MAG: hypothetical protein KHX03_00055 [Clostridium sp.]|nr:hypothetical protein [Clostridium sp.]